MFEYRKFPAFVRLPIFFVYVGMVLYLHLVGLHLLAFDGLRGWGSALLMLSMVGAFFGVAFVVLVRTYRGSLGRGPAVAIALGGVLLGVSTPTGVACQVDQGSLAGVQLLPYIVWNVGTTSAWGFAVPAGWAYIVNGGCRVEVFLNTALSGYLLLGWGAWNDPLITRLIGQPASGG